MKTFGHAILLFSIAAAPAFASDSGIPSDAHAYSDLVASSHWTWTHDAKTPGSSVASSHYPEGSPSLDGKSREFSFAYSNKGGERFSPLATTQSTHILSTIPTFISMIHHSWPTWNWM